MTSHPHALCLDAHDPLLLARVWADFLCWETSEDSSDGITLLPGDGTGFQLRFLPTQERKTGQNHMHFDLTSTSLDDQKQVVERALELGARHIDIGQRPEEGHVVLADPDGHEFCVLTPR
ncbi:VOC family protein [Streptomyces sp. RGM 3693]|uniref:VOC family protein n=1 Tax=Streptomyces sp. RGM 3693 TaxID=3413284 RepID=UPI003D28A69E